MNKRLLILLFAGAVVLVLLFTSNGSGQVANDSDGDGWSDGYETYIGTSPLSACVRPDVDPTVQGWPPDFSNNGTVDVSDLTVITQLWESETTAPGVRRYDISGEPMGSGVVDISDVVIVTGLFGTSC